MIAARVLGRFSRLSHVREARAVAARALLHRPYPSLGLIEPRPVRSTLASRDAPAGHLTRFVAIMVAS